MAPRGLGATPASAPARPGPGAETLQKLTEIYQDELQLAPLEPRQIVGVDELPAPPVDIENIPTRRLGGIAQEGTDATTTGTVVQ